MLTWKLTLAVLEEHSYLTIFQHLKREQYRFVATELCEISFMFHDRKNKL